MSAGQVILAVLSEAMREFGPAYSSQNPDVIAFVKRRISEIRGGSAPQPTPFRPRDFDAKARQFRDD